MNNAEGLAYLIIFATCLLIAVGALWSIKWMILNWPADPDETPSAIRWLQDALKY